MGVKRSRQHSVSSSDDPSTPYSHEPSADVKIVHLDAESAAAGSLAVMKCSLPPHEPLGFASFEEYDVHYQKAHVNRCTECHKNFPDERFLLLHITEYHDPIVAAKRDQGEKTYACLLATCDRVCSTPQNRRLHCIDKHHYPRDFDFIVVKDGIDRRSSMLRSHRRRSSAFSSNGTNAPSGRRRGESTASAAPESMDVVKDQEENRADDEEREKDLDTKRYPSRLRGRGGFGHSRVVSGQGRGTSAVTSPVKPARLSVTPSADPMESLAAGMSALQFVPHSVRAARGRGRGTGG